MNDSGYRALGFGRELVPEAVKYFGAARELIVEEVGDEGDPRSHPDYPRMRRGELLVAAWNDPASSLDELEQTARDQPALFGPEDWREQIRTYSLAERFAEAFAIAQHAASAYPEDAQLTQQRENLARRLRPEDPIPLFEPEG
ncbi:MAG: hypothetical protein AAFZ65_09030 [Planctomycetota bacterium]